MHTRSGNLLEELADEVDDEMVLRADRVLRIAKDVVLRLQVVEGLLEHAADVGRDERVSRTEAREDLVEPEKLERRLGR